MGYAAPVTIIGQDAVACIKALILEYVPGNANQPPPNIRQLVENVIASLPKELSAISIADVELIVDGMVSDGRLVAAHKRYCSD